MEKLKPQSKTGMNNIGTAYVLWLGCLLQLHGLQRLYNGKIFTGLLWMFTFGLFGVGQLIDLLLIPGMVDEYNAKLGTRSAALPGTMSPALPQVEQVVRQERREYEPRSSSNFLVVRLIKAAEARGGKLSVTQGVMATGASFPEVEATLKGLLKTGYVDVVNDPETGVVLYEFHEL